MRWNSPLPFDPRLDSQTSEDDRRVLLRVQDLVRSRGAYCYLEIGSHLGGTLQTHYADERCTRITSIDPRPKFVPDARGRSIHYKDNSTAAMLEMLRLVYPTVDAAKVVTFDSDASAVDPSRIETPDLCLIDGEHTFTATVSDFAWCQRVASPDAVYIFHDTNILFDAIATIEAQLVKPKGPVCGLLLSGVVYVLLTGRSVDWYREALQPMAQNREERFAEWALARDTERRKNRWSRQRVLRDTLSHFPRLYDAARYVRQLLAR